MGKTMESLHTGFSPSPTRSGISFTRCPYWQPKPKLTIVKTHAGTSVFLLDVPCYSSAQLRPALYIAMFTVCFPEEYRIHLLELSFTMTVGSKFSQLNFVCPGLPKGVTEAVVMKPKSNRGLISDWSTATHKYAHALTSPRVHRMNVRLSVFSCSKIRKLSKRSDYAIRYNVRQDFCF